MLSPRVRAYRDGACHRLNSLFQAMVLAVMLSACSTQPQGRPVATAAAPGQVQQLEACSIIGVMACAAMSMLPGDNAGERRSTCVAIRTANGTRVETCGSVEAKTQPPMATDQQAATKSVRLAWSDNSNNEANFVIERCDRVNLAAGSQTKTPACSGGWRAIGTVGADTTGYVDTTALPNQTYIYRVKATNRMGSSAYSNEALIMTPAW